MEKVLIYGIGSFKNHGCEAIVNATIKSIDKKKYFLGLACHDLKYNMKFYNNDINEYVLHSYSLNSLDDCNKSKYYNYVENREFLNAEEIMYKSVIDKINEYDFFISAGGDNYSYGYSYWLYAIHNEIKRQNKKSVLWGASLYDKLLDRELINDLRKYDLLVLRESISYSAAKEHIDESKLMLVPDPAFALEPKQVNLDNWYFNRDIIAINVSPLTIKNEEQYASVVMFINYLLENTNYSILLLPHVLIDGCNDLDVLERLKNDFISNDKVYLEDREYNCEELKYIISRCKMVIAGRTHASIAAYSSFVPTIVIGYSVKSRGIATDLFGKSEIFVIPNEILNYENLLSSFNYVLDNYDNLKGILKEKCSEYKKLASNLMDMVNDRLKLNEKKVICSKKMCNGCGTCLQSCSKGAISMKVDEEGFVYPVIDLDKCNSCNICRKSCPVLNNKKKEFSPLCYAAKNKNVEIQKNSSSGGVFSVLADYVFNKKGIVYGVVLDGNYVTKHIRVINSIGLEKIRGSKYTQSNSFEVFMDVKKDLEDKKLVLFSGTPCQIAALKNYLRKNYVNLICVSVICHGVTSSKLFHKYLDEIYLDKDDKSNYFNFKDSKKGWSVSKVSYKTNGKVCEEQFRENPFMNLYVNNYILRESCYNCSFKGIENQKADIILGDYWGVMNYHKELFDENGISCVIALTDIGKKLLHEKYIKNSLILEETKIENIIAGNSLLVNSASRVSERDTIFYQLESNSFNIISKNFYLVSENEELKTTLKKVELDLSSIYEQNKAIINSKGWRLLEKIRKLIRRR